MLENLTVDDFTPELGKRFILRLPDRPPLELVLVEARELSRIEQSDSGNRAPFSVLFRGPREPLLPQRIYPLESAALGRLEILLVPVGTSADGIDYEAIFN